MCSTALNFIQNTSVDNSILNMIWSHEIDDLSLKGGTACFDQYLQFSASCVAVFLSFSYIACVSTF